MSNTDMNKKVKWTAFIEGFASQWPLKALYNIALAFTHKCTHSRTDGGVNHARQQPGRREQVG